MMRGVIERERERRESCEIIGSKNNDDITWTYRLMELNRRNKEKERERKKERREKVNSILLVAFSRERERAKKVEKVKHT